MTRQTNHQRLSAAFAAILAFVVLANPALAQFQPRDPLPKGDPPLQPDFEHRLVVKFNDDLLVRATDEGVVSLAGVRLDVVDMVMQDFGAVFSQRINLPQEDLDALEQRALDLSGIEQADFAGILEVDAPIDLLQLVSDALWQSPQTEWVAFEMIAPPPPCVDASPVTSSYIGNQDYRGSDPGLNYNAALALGNMTGAGIRLIDCEYDVHETHEDLCNINFPVGLTPDSVSIANWNDDAIDHGSASLGASVSLDNGYGTTGLSPDAEAWFCSEWSAQHGVDRATAVAEAVSIADPGDVVLLEMQTTIAGPGDFGPAELNQTIFMLTENATQAEIIVVAAAGNGTQDLDSLAYNFYNSWGDSGAIIVGAGSSDTAHDTLWFSSFGSRVNVQGWGENVATLGYGTLAQVNGSSDEDQFYADDFSGTSSASAMVAGAVAALQSHAVATCGRLLPNLMRDVLINTGVPQGSGGHIGPFPDMLAAAQSLAPQTVNVPADFTTIQAAINAALCGYEIVVEPGTYNEHINLMGKTVHLRSSQGPAVTIIDGQGNFGSVVTCAGGETQSTILEGFTITGGNGAGLGGGMNITNDSSPTVINCTFINNTANWGGGVRLTTLLNTESTFTNCRFTENSAERGGGMHKGGSGVVHLVNCEFEANTASEQGGGLWLTGSSTAYLTATNCTFTNNFAGSIGGGVFNGGGSNNFDTVFDNCLFESNSTSSTTSGGGMYISTSGSGTTLINCVFQDNQSGHGGAIVRIESIPSSTTDIVGCEFRNNTAFVDGGAINNSSNVNSIPTIGNSLFCENTPNDIVGNWSDQGGNQFTLNCPVTPGPLHDDCANPVPVNVGLTVFDNLNATTDGPPDCGFFQGDVAGNSDADVWHEFTAPCDGLVTFTFEPQYDHIHAIYPQPPCASPGVAPMVCNMVPAGSTHTFNLTLIAGQTYTIRIGGDQGQTGMGEMTIACPCDFFDSYDPVIIVPDQSAWEPWNGDPVAADFYVSNAQSLTAPYSLAIDGADDAVHQYYDRTSGGWEFTANVYVPQSATGSQFFVLLNTYPAVNSEDWSLGLEMDASANTISDFSSSASLPLVKGQWTEIRVEIDLNNDQQLVFYDNQLLATKSWTGGVAPGGALNIAAVDLWGNSSPDEFYYDDLCLEEALCICPWDLTGDCVVDVQDLLTMLSQWGTPYGTQQLLQLLSHWGPCP